MKKFTQFFTAMVTVLGMIFIGFTMGMNKDLLVKWYNYGCYLATHNTDETEVISSDGELMNAAQNNWVESHGKGETVVRMLSVEDGINGRLEQEAREEDKSHTFIGTWTEICMFSAAHAETEVHFICTDDGMEGYMTFHGNPLWGPTTYTWSYC